MKEVWDSKNEHNWSIIGKILTEVQKKKSSEFVLI